MDYSEFVVVLDRSGSMQAAREDHEGGLNSFVRDQRGLEGEVRFTYIQFDSQDPCEVVYDGVPIEEVKECVLIPRGMTPLFDAVGQSVAHVTKRLKKAERQPDQVVFMIITDGQENASREWTKERVKKLVQECEEKRGWKFLFLGANIDAFATGGGIGVAAGTTMDFANNAVGTRSMYDAVTRNSLKSRTLLRSASRDAVTGRIADEAVLTASMSSYNFDDSQRAAAMGDADPPTTTTTLPRGPRSRKERK